MNKKDMLHALKSFFFPQVSFTFLIRLASIAVVTYFIFTYIFIPLKIKGHSMAPTYKDGQINICFRLKYLFSKPKRNDVVVVRFAGTKVMLLKRIVALEGERLAFRDGRLFINGKLKTEPYIHDVFSWNLSPRKVEKGKVYLIGDNRKVPMDQHDFGQTSVKRIIGSPLW